MIVELYKNIDKNIITNYVEMGLITVRDHPTYDLQILNYTAKVQYEHLWDNFTLQCRGLIIDSSGKVIAKSWPKFFNIEENKHIATSEFTVTSKLDGSLIILFKYNNDIVIATRGSFTSDQAIEARKIFYELGYDKYEWKDGYSYLFEVIYKDNRIVVDYGDDRKLVLLSIIDMRTMQEIEYNQLVHEVNSSVMIVDSYSGISDYTILKNLIKPNEEGFVVRFSNGDRCKIKGAEYIQLHKIITRISPKFIWETLSKGESLNTLLDCVPDEFYSYIKEEEEVLNAAYKQIETHYKMIYEKISNLPHVKLKKDFALEALKYEHSAILFKMFDNKEYTTYIWNMLRPKQ